MTYILYLSAAVAGLACSKSKTVTVYVYAVMLFLAGFRTSDSDMGSYIYEYSHAFDAYNSGGRYIGYQYVIRFFNLLGMSFQEYLFVFYAALFLVLIYAVRMLTVRVNTVLSLYLLTFFGIDVIQMKSFIAGIFAFACIACLLCMQEGMVTKQKKRLHITVFVLLETAALLMHFSYLFFLAAGMVFVLLKRKNTMKYWIYAFLTAAVFLVYSGITGVILSWAVNAGIIGSYDAEYMQQFFSVQTRFGALIPVSWTVLLVYFMCHSKSCQYSGSQVKFLYADTAMNDFVRTCLLLIPCFFVYVFFSRLLRPYMLFAYIALADRRIIRGKIRLASVSGMAFLGALVMGYGLDIIPAFSGTIGSLLGENAFL